MLTDNNKLIELRVAVLIESESGKEVTGILSGKGKSRSPSGIKSVLLYL